jgi:hypothetical protein
MFLLAIDPKTDSSHYLVGSFRCMMYFFSEVFFSIFAKPPKSWPLSGASLALVDDDDDRRELRENGGHRPGVLASQVMKNDG